MEPITLVLSLLAGTFPGLLKIMRETEELKSLWNRIERNSFLLSILKALGLELPKPKDSYETRMNSLIAKFNEVTIESDAIIAELESNLKNKKHIVETLEQEEEILATNIEKMRKSPEFGQLQIQQQLDRLIQEQKKDGKKGLLRDYLLFALGVVSPYIISWTVKLFQ
jgi:hypothetical protein